MGVGITSVWQEITILTAMAFLLLSIALLKFKKRLE
jgi:ABC-type transport system involved in multi-copper enzyme maturation permease subunit